MDRSVFETIETLARFDGDQRAEFCRVLTKRYPESKTIRNALLKRNKLDRKIAVCAHDNIDYKSPKIKNENLQSTLWNLVR